jgi:hypothetical protein
MGRSEDQPFERFRRGCLKGTSYVQCGEFLCKCEERSLRLQILQSVTFADYCR